MNRRTLRIGVAVLWIMLSLIWIFQGDGFPETWQWVMRLCIFVLFVLSLTEKPLDKEGALMWGMYLLVLISHIIRGNIKLP